jgi:signal transduction histidine kinase
MIESNLPFYNKILVLLINFLGIWLTAIVWQHASRDRIRKIFLGMFLSMFFWVNFAYLARLGGERFFELSFVFLKVAWFATPILFFLIYFLIVAFSGKEKKYKHLNVAVFAAGAFSALIAGFTDLTIGGLRFVNGDLVIEYGGFMYPFLLMIAFLMLATIYVLVKECLHSSRSEDRKEALLYIFIGICLFYGANLVFNITLPLFFHQVNLYWIGDYSSIFLLGFLSYAVVKQELFGVKVMYAKALVVIISILLLVDVTASKTLWGLLWSFLLFASFVSFGVLLIRSMRKEIDNRRRLRAAYQRLKKVDKAKTEFLSIASHQLRTPLTSIKGYVSMILEGDFGKISPKQKQALQKVFQSNDRLVQLVENLLNVSRISQGRMSYNFEKGDLDKVVDKVIDELKPEAVKKRIKLTYKKPKSLARVRMDWEKISEVATNLIDNAIKYTPPGGEINIKLQNSDTRSENPKVKCSISDNGMGISEDEMRNLFEKFSRAESSSVVNTEGTGLGLYVARKIIKDHGGSVWAESGGKGKGSKFIFELPIS